MNARDKIYALIGEGLRWGGIGSTIYGMLDKDICMVVGGFALSTAGSSMNRQYVESFVAEVQIGHLSKIAKSLESIAKK